MTPGSIANQICWSRIWALRASVVLGAMGVLWGWIPALGAILPVSIHPWMGVFLLLGGLGVAWVRKRPASSGGSVVCASLGLLMVLVSGLSCLHQWSALSPDYGIRAGITSVEVVTWPMPLLESASLVLLGAALLLVPGSGVDSWRRLQDLVLVAVLTIAALATIGHLCGLPSFYGQYSRFAGRGLSMAEVAGIATLAWSLLVSRPELGLARVIVSESAAGMVARRLLLAPVVVPLATGLLANLAHRLGHWNAEWVGWWISFLNIFGFALVIWWITRLLFLAELRRQAAERAVEEAHGELERRVVERTAELEATRKRADWLATFPERNPNPVLELGYDGTLHYLNPAAVILFPNLAEQGFRHPLLAGLQHGTTGPVAASVHLRDVAVGSRWYSQTVTVLPEERRIRVYNNDVTERKRVEESLRQSQFVLERAQEVGRIGSWATLVRAGSVELTWSNETSRIFGLDDGTFDGRVETLYSLVHPEDLPRLMACREAALRGTGQYDLEHRIIRPDGVVRWVHQRADAVWDDRSETTHFVGVIHDITERRNSELSLSRERNLLRLLIDHLPAAIYMKDFQGRFLLLNPAATRLWGVATEAQALGKLWTDLPSADWLRPLEEADRETFEHQQPMNDRELRVTDPSGSQRWFVTTALPLHPDHGPKGLLGICQDITDRKIIEYRLQAQLERLGLLSRTTRAMAERQDLPSLFRVVVQNLEAELEIDFGCVCLLDERDLVVTCVGQGSRSLAGTLELERGVRLSVDANGLARCLRGELVQEPDTRILPFSFPRRLARGGLHSVVLAPLSVEGRVFGVLIAARRPCQAFGSGDCEFFLQLSEQVALAIQQTRLYEDLQKAYDHLRQTQDALVQRERLQALGQMASGIAHDINNAISPIALYTESLLERETGLSPRGRESLETIQRAVGDVAETVARMRNFSRPVDKMVGRQRVHLNELVTQVIELTRPRWSDMAQRSGISISVVTECEAQIPPIAAVASELRDALVNLVFNALDAMTSGGTLTLRTGHLEPAGTGGSGVFCEVQDTGIGMDEEVRRRCLEPFFTTKGERGTGLGLAMVFGAVQRQGATLEIRSTPGQGTTVRLGFPHEEIESEGPLVSTVEKPKWRRCRVLIIDDDPILIRSLRDSLELDEHEVMAALGGQEGIVTFERETREGRHFDLVITDLGMPVVDGRKVAEALKRIRPEVPILLLTGWGQRMQLDDEIVPGVDRILGKPPRLDELRQSVRELVRPGLSVRARGV